MGFGTSTSAAASTESALDYGSDTSQCSSDAGGDTHGGRVTRTSSASASSDPMRLSGLSATSDARSLGTIEGRDPSIDLESSARKGFTGLRNLGNTCYMNSAIQCLSHTVPLVDYFLNCDWQAEINRENVLGHDGAMAMAYSRLLEKLWRGHRAVHNPKGFKSALCRVAPHFRGYEQHDAQELLVFLLDGLHEDLNRVSKKPYVEDAECDGRPEEVVAAESWKGYLLRNKSIVVDLFQGQLRSTLECCHCGYKRVKFDPFMYLSLPVPEGKARREPATLDDCLREFAKEEMLTGDEQWRCSKCKDFRDAKKKFDIWKVPPVLIVHLKRFKYLPTGERRKVRTFVDFPGGNWSLRNHVKSPQREKPIYDLFAVSNHHGGFGSGHYTAFCKGRNMSGGDKGEGGGGGAGGLRTASGQHKVVQGARGAVHDDGLGVMDWYHFNDSSYERVDTEDAVKSEDAYVLFYNKMTTVSKKGKVKYSRQSVSLPHLWPHLIDGGGGGGGRETPTPAASTQEPISEVVNELAETPPAARDLWEPLKSSDGRTYYHNVHTGETAWEKPAN